MEYSYIPSKEPAQYHQRKKKMGFFSFLSYQSSKNIVRIMFRARDIFRDRNHIAQKRNNELFPSGIKSHYLGYIIS